MKNIILTLWYLLALLYELITDVSGQPLGSIFENRPLKLGLYRPSRNVGNYQSTLRDTPEEGRYYLQGGGKLKWSELLLLLLFAQITISRL